jgi:hypothetical protein
MDPRGDAVSLTGDIRVHEQVDGMGCTMEIAALPHIERGRTPCSCGGVETLK